MPDRLCYPSLQCVLEYMEANKRIYLASRCPNLFHVEKSIPLRIRYILFKPNFLRINDLTYSISEREVQYEPTLSEINERIAPYKITQRVIQIFKWKPVIKKFIDIQFKRESGVVRERQLPVHTKISVVTKKLTTFLLGGRTSIRVFESLDLNIDKGNFLRIPEKLKIWTKSLNTYKKNFKSYLFLVHPSSFPLKLLVAEITAPGDLQHPVVCTAQELRLKMFPSDEVLGVRNLTHELEQFPHKNVHLRGYHLSISDIIDIIQYWKDHGKDLGTCWSTDLRYRCTVTEAMRHLTTEFEGWYRETTRDRYPGFRYYLSIPFNKTSNLNISSIQDPTEPGRKLLQLKIEPIEIENIEISKFFHYWYALHSDHFYVNILLTLLLFPLLHLWVITLAPQFFFEIPFTLCIFSFSYIIFNLLREY